METNHHPTCPHHDSRAAKDKCPVAPVGTDEVPKTLILTGASRGIGHATVKLFNEHNWRVITISRHPFSSHCAWHSGAENHIQMDLNNTSMIEKGIDELREKVHGPIHALVNNAGISPKSKDGSRLGILDTDYAAWIHVFNVNLFASMQLSRGLFDLLKAGHGSIINVCSVAGTRVHPFAGSAYATSKAALLTLTHEMAHEFAPYGIRVNAVSPGEIKTPILSPDTEKVFADKIPLKRLGSTDEVASVIYFLCSGAASYVNGTEIYIDGGQHV